LPTPTYTPLANITLGSSASSVSFSSIPASFRDLVLVIDGTASVSTNVQVRFNGDSNNNYLYVAMYGNGSTTSSFAESNISSITQLALANYSSNTLTQIMDYSATDKHKTVLIRSNGGNGFVQATAGRWGSTSAITSMVLTSSGSGATFNSGSNFALYGIAS